MLLFGSRQKMAQPSKGHRKTVNLIPEQAQGKASDGCARCLSKPSTFSIVSRSKNKLACVPSCSVHRNAGVGHTTEAAQGEAPSVDQ